MRELEGAMHVFAHNGYLDARLRRERLAIDPTESAQHVVPVASVPLTPEPGWRALGEGELIAVRGGAIAAG